MGSAKVRLLMVILVMIVFQNYIILYFNIQQFMLSIVSIMHKFKRFNTIHVHNFYHQCDCPTQYITRLESAIA